MADLIHLLYVGGDRFIIGVPACDHDVNADEADALIATGLYEPQPEPIPDVVDGVDAEGDN
jgi:hypothetical protein